MSSWPTFLSVSGGTFTYLVLGHFVHPEPDMENIGFLGGLFDHPFRYSDDINRFMILLVVVLWPARFVAESLWDGFDLIVLSPYRDRLS